MMHMALVDYAQKYVVNMPLFSADVDQRNATNSNHMCACPVANSATYEPACGLLHKAFKI